MFNSPRRKRPEGPSEAKDILTLRRVWVSGVPGAGKTTLARQISHEFDLPHTELDALYWQEGWTTLSHDDFRHCVNSITLEDRWVIDGYFAEVVDLIDRRLDTFIWLDVALPIALSRVLGRTYRRVKHQERFWNGNIETWRSVLSRRSIIVYALTSYRDIRSENRGIWEQFGRRGIQRYRFTNTSKDSLRSLK